MPYPDFYNVNANIKYPFVVPSTGKYLFTEGFELLDAVVLDCGFTFGSRAEFISGVNIIWLSSLRRDGQQYTFTFTSDAVTGKDFVFVLYETSPYGATAYTVAATPDYGVGFLATGDLTSLQLLPNNTTVYALIPPIDNQPRAQVEPSLVVSKRGQDVWTVNVGNWDRPVALNCCDTPPSPPTPGTPITVVMEPNGSSLTGTVQIKPGVNMTASVDDTTSTVTLAPVMGAGEGTTCEDQTPEPADAIRCSDLIYTINGVKPAGNGSFQFVGGSGIYVDTYPSTHTLVIRGELTTEISCP